MSSLNEVAEALKHLPGQHDQSLHAGVGGRAGQGGRAQPKVGSKPNRLAGLSAKEMASHIADMMGAHFGRSSEGKIFVGKKGNHKQAFSEILIGLGFSGKGSRFELMASDAAGVHHKYQAGLDVTKSIAGPTTTLTIDKTL